MSWANSVPMMAWHTAGRLGDGGGPGTLACIFPPPRPMILGDAQALEIGERDAAHHRAPVQPCPRATLDMAQPKLSLELLVRLLTHPARLDGGSQRAHRSAGQEGLLR